MSNADSPTARFDWKTALLAGAATAFCTVAGTNLAPRYILVLVA
jgi:hypothetical protein